MNGRPPGGETSFRHAVATDDNLFQQRPVLHQQSSTLSAKRSQSGLSAKPLFRLVSPDPFDVSSKVNDHCWSHFVLTERNPMRLVWSGIVLVLLLYTATVFLYRFTFYTFHINENGPDPIGTDDPAWRVIDDLVDVLFWMDLVLTFFISYKDERGNEVDSMRLIAHRYLLGYFWVNLVACLPNQLVSKIILTLDSTASGPGVNKIARVARLQRVSRLARLVRLTRLAKLASLDMNNAYWMWLQGLRGVRVVNFAVGLFWTMHVLACFWYLSAALQENSTETWVGRHAVDASKSTSLLERDPAEQWLVSMYFVLTVFTTVGFGDISPGTNIEILAVVVIMVFGAVVHSIIISEVIQIITSTDQVQDFVEKQVKLFDAFAGHSEISELSQRRLKQELQYRAKAWAKSHSYDKQAVLEMITGDHMPRWVIAEMSANSFHGELTRNAFVNVCLGSAHLPPRLPLLIAAHSARARFEVNETVYQMHDFPFNLFLVLSGTFANVARPTATGGVDESVTDHRRVPMEMLGLRSLQVRAGCIGHVSSSNSSLESQRLQPYKLYGFRCYFGDFELMEGRPRNASVRCEKEGEVLVLKKQSFADMQSQFPQFQNGWLQAARVREYTRQQACKRLTASMPLRQFAATRIQTFFKTRHAGEQQASRQMLAWVKREISAFNAARTFAPTDPGQQQMMKKVDHLCLDMKSLRADFEAFRREMRGLFVAREGTTASI